MNTKRCDVCGVDVSSTNWSKHVKTAKHKKNSESGKPSYEGFKSFCQLCQVPLKDAFDVIGHVNGKSHREKVLTMVDRFQENKFFSENQFGHKKFNADRKLNGIVKFDEILRFCPDAKKVVAPKKQGEVEAPKTQRISQKIKPKSFQEDVDRITGLLKRKFYVLKKTSGVTKTVKKSFAEKRKLINETLKRGNSRDVYDDLAEINVQLWESVNKLPRDVLDQFNTIDLRLKSFDPGRLKL